MKWSFLAKEKSNSNKLFPLCGFFMTFEDLKCVIKLLFSLLTASSLEDQRTGVGAFSVLNWKGEDAESLKKFFLLAVICVLELNKPEF